MYPRNAASPEPLAIGTVLLTADGTVQTSGVTVRIKPVGVAEADGAGTVAYSTDGVVLYTPTQSETNYTSFILIAKKTSCIPVAITVVTSATSVAGTVDVGRISGDATAADNAESFFDGTGYAGTNNVIPTVTTLTNKTGFSLTATTGLGNQTANITGNLSGSVGSVSGAVGSVTGNVGGNVTGSVGSVTGAVTVGTINANAMNASALATDAVTEIATAVEVQLGLSGSDLDATLNTMQGLLVGIDAVTDKLDTAMVLDGSVYQFTTNALENAPGGAGGLTAADVWDYAIAGSLDAGSTGAALNAAGGSGDPWSSSLPGAYVAGQAGKMLADINGKAALITSGNVQFTSMVNTQGKITTPIHIGDDYLASNGRAFEWTIDARSGFVVGTSTCKFGGYNAKTESEWLVTGTVSDLGGGEWKLSFDLDKDVTSTLEPGVYQWSVEIANAGGDEITEVYSGQNVTVKRKQT
jgi:hypothetical protein